MIEGIPSDKIDENFHLFKDLIEKAITNRRFTQLHDLKSIKEALLSKEMQLWYCHDDEGECVIITSIINYPLTKRLEVNYVGGDRIEGFFLESYNALKQFAKGNNCKQLTGFGRKGWLKLIPDDVRYHALWDVDI